MGAGVVGIRAGDADAGLALFYGGLVRTKNVLGTIMQSIMILSVVSLLWILFGYSLAFGPDKGGVIGGLDWIGLSGGQSRRMPYTAQRFHTRPSCCFS